MAPFKVIVLQQLQSGLCGRPHLFCHINFSCAISNRSLISVFKKLSVGQLESEDKITRKVVKITPPVVTASV